MPLSTLIVEGSLDVQIMTAVLRGDPLVEPGGSKNALKPQALKKRTADKVLAGYLRDRDFDYEPPDDRDSAAVDSTHVGATLGWRWVRHEIENYLIDPLIVEGALGVDAQVWSDTLTGVASRIRWYQIARWTLGEVRRALPPQYELRTRCDALGDFQLPDEISESACLTWCRNSIVGYRDRIAEQMSDTKVAALIEARSVALSPECLAQVDNALVWCSGKDLLAGLSAAVLESAKAQTPGELRSRLRDWIRSHPDAAVDCFAEWRDLIRQLRA